VAFAGCLLACAGCDEDIAGEVATLSGGYVGDVVSVLATRCLQDALGVEAADSESADEHTSEALHDHEH
jgi:organic radical activating enzyme